MNSERTDHTAHRFALWRRYRISLWLVDTGALLLALAGIALPARTIVGTPTSFAETIASPSPIDVAALIVQPIGDATFELSLTLHSFSTDVNTSSPAVITLELPKSVRVLGCDVYCLDHSGAVNDIWGVVVDFVQHGSGAGSYFLAEGRVTIRSPNLLWSTDGTILGGELPGARLIVAGQAVTTSDVATQSPELITHFVFAHADGYDWIGGPPPYYLDGNGVAWRHSVEAAAEPVFVSGVNRHQQDLDDVRVFVAGALVGIAGGAVVAALQEFLHARERRHENGVQRNS